MKKIFIAFFLLILFVGLFGCDVNGNRKKPTVDMLYQNWYNCVSLPNMEDPFIELYDGSYSVSIDRDNNVILNTINQKKLKGVLVLEEKEYTYNVEITFENNDIAKGTLYISGDKPYLSFYYHGFSYCFTNTKSITIDEFIIYRDGFNKFLRESFLNDSYPTLEEVEFNHLYSQYTNFVHIDPCCNGPKVYVGVNKVLVEKELENNEFIVTYQDDTVKNINSGEIEAIVLVKLDGTFERLNEIKNGLCFITETYSLFYFECEHQWDEGIEIASGTGAYMMEYTCKLCNEKYEDIITIIPPEVLD